MEICRSCGAELQPGALYCTKCGARSQTTEPIEPNATPTEPYTAPAEPYTAPAEPYTAPTEPYTAPTEPYTAPVQPYSSAGGAQQALPPQPEARATYNAQQTAAQGRSAAENAARASSPFSTGQGGAAGAPYNTYSAYPNAVPRAGNEWMGIVSLICGILSLPCCFTCYGGLLLGVAGVIFGILGLKTANRSFSIAGIICGGVGMLLSAALLSTMFVTDVFSGGGVQEFIDELPVI